MKKILVIGNGWLGRKICEYLSADMYKGRIEDICTWDSHEILNYDVIVNAAAKTQIDWCEKHKTETLENNALAAQALARVCEEHGKQYVFISSACIFESKDGFDWKDEFAEPNPACFYAKSKAIAEELILEVSPKALIVRPRLPISEVPHPRNTFDKLMKYKKLQTNQESVTVVEDMLPVFKDLIEKGSAGTYNLVNAGTISPAEIGKMMGLEFEEISKVDMDLQMLKEGKARRVTSLITSTAIPLLPNIKDRMPDIIKKHQAI